MGPKVKHATSGEWIPVTPYPETILVIVGDLLDFWTSGYYPATVYMLLKLLIVTHNHNQSSPFLLLIAFKLTMCVIQPHRVIYPNVNLDQTNIPRYSFAYFVPPDSSTPMIPLESEVLHLSSVIRTSESYHQTTPVIRTAIDFIREKCKKAYQY
jgi:isopenicillin N synthase-like dioxygenase